MGVGGRGDRVGEISNLSFVRPFTRNTGNIVGRATSINQGRQVGLAAVEISDRDARTIGYGTTRCLVVDTPVDPDAEYAKPDTGPDDPPDPYMREAPSDGYFDLESVSNGRPIDLQRRIFSGELTPNVMRLDSASWELVEEGIVLARFPTSP